MIKFFRKTRKILINEGKTRRYFKYAIGEIVLVVVGILIALWLNQLNEKKVKRRQELQTLVQLKGEFEANLLQLDEKISMRASMIQAGSRLLYFHDNPEKIYKDSVATLLARTSVAPTFDPITNDLISGGRLYLITNPELKTMLSKWPSDLVQVTEEEIAWIFILRNTYMPYLSANYPIRNLNEAKWNKLDVVQTLLLEKNKLTTNVIGHSKEVFDVEAFLANPKLADQFSTVISSCLFAKTQSEYLRKSISKILFLIKKELKGQP
jgi:hypothetical protein|tara:strand:+ start:3868 stop:4665 length:798 start_codon:yes stop_codon:yes gene_type:complete